MGSIYKITNTINGKSYIGQTRRDAVNGRIRQHLNGHPRGNQLVKQAIEKYGKNAFTYEILHDGIIPEFLDTFEVEAIAKFNTIAPQGYNLTAGGEGGSRSEETKRKISRSKKGENHPMFGKPPTKGFLGKRHTPETCRKISEATTGEKNHRYGKLAPNRGKPHSAKTRRKISEARKGKKHSEEAKRKMSGSKKGEKHPMYGKPSPKGFLGKKHSDETLQRMSEAQKGKKNHQYGKPLSPEHCQKLSEARETPERIAAREFFFSLPADMPLTEKRKRLRQKFPEKHYNTIYKWCKKFDSEI